MEKIKTNKKTKTIQITYPAPYSHSWNNDGPPVLMKNTLGRSANFFKCPKRSKDPPRAWSQSYSTVRGPDPTAPHLKYGVFTNRRVSSSRTLQRQMPQKPHLSPHTINLQLRQPAQDLANNKSNILDRKKILQRKAQITESPVFVFRTIDKRYTRQLSLSEIMHVDIKPKRLALIPTTFCPSPNFKMMSPKLVVSPIARSPR